MSSINTFPALVYRVDQEVELSLPVLLPLREHGLVMRRGREYATALLVERLVRDVHALLRFGPQHYQASGGLDTWQKLY